MGAFCSPLPLFWILILLSFVLYRLKYAKTCRLFLYVAFAQLFLFSVTPLPIWMLERLERQYAVHDAAPNGSSLPVLVLGGGHTNDESLEPLQRLSAPALARLCEGIRQHRLNNGGKLVLSGYSESGSTSVSETMALTALSLGIGHKDTLMMTKPGTTWEEAQEYKKRFGTKSKFILVTSASHMPRAMETFKNAGLHPVPAPAFFQIKSSPGKSVYGWKPSGNKLNYTETAMHEYVGMIYYRWFKE